MSDELARWKGLFAPVLRLNALTDLQTNNSLTETEYGAIKSISAHCRESSQARLAALAELVLLDVSTRVLAVVGMAGLAIVVGPLVKSGLDEWACSVASDHGYEHVFALSCIAPHLPQGTRRHLASIVDGIEWPAAVAAVGLNLRAKVDARHPSMDEILRAQRCELLLEALAIASSSLLAKNKHAELCSLYSKEILSHLSTFERAPGYALSLAVYLYNLARVAKTQMAALEQTVKHFAFVGRLAQSREPSDRLKQVFANVAMLIAQHDALCGHLVQQGALKMLLRMDPHVETEENSELREVLAAHQKDIDSISYAYAAHVALARIAIAINPDLSFGSERMPTLVRFLRVLATKNDESEEQYVGLLALTNVAAVSPAAVHAHVQPDAVANCCRHAWVTDIVQPALGAENLQIRRAAFELLINLMSALPLFPRVPPFFVPLAAAHSAPCEPVEWRGVAVAALAVYATLYAESKVDLSLADVGFASPIVEKLLLHAEDETDADVRAKHAFLWKCLTTCHRPVAVDTARLDKVLS